MFKTPLMLVPALAVLAIPAVAQQHQGMKHEGGDGMKSMMESPWREMNGFHSLLHLSHQALMKSGDLTPARRNAGLLSDAADAWAKSTPPPECKAPADIGERVSALAVEVKAYSALVAENGTDDEVKAALNKIHDDFQATHMGCMPMGMGKGMGGMGKKGPPPR